MVSSVDQVGAESRRRFSLAQPEIMSGSVVIIAGLKPSGRTKDVVNREVVGGHIPYSAARIRRATVSDLLADITQHQTVGGARRELHGITHRLMGCALVQVTELHRALVAAVQINVIAGSIDGSDAAHPALITTHHHDR